MPCNHIMLDLETLSLRKDAAIIQIAALAFDPETGETGASFNVHVRNSGGHVDVQTCAWWMQQAGAHGMGLAVASEEAYDERAALVEFSEWLTAAGPIAALWSHGAIFDIVVLENAYARHGFVKQWSYKVERDTRTLYAIAPDGMPDVPADPEQEHDALYDCERQVKQVCGALAALRA